MLHRPMLLLWTFLTAWAPAVLHAEAIPSQWVTQDAHIHYTVFHPLHNVQAMTRQVEGFVRTDNDGLHLTISSAVTSFFSSNMARDARVAELVDAAHFPAVIVEAFMPKYVLHETRESHDVPLTVAITLHGVGTDVPVVAHVSWPEAQRMRVGFSLVDSIEAHGLTKPRFWLWPVHDAMQIQGEIDLVAGTIQEMQPKGEYSE